MEAADLFMRLGDCSGDEAVNLADAIAIVHLLWSREEVPCTTACDIDGSHRVSVADAILLLSALFRQNEAPDARLGECTPTRDAQCSAASCGTR